MDVSLRLRFLRGGESFKIICAPDQIERLGKVASHNGGELAVEKVENEAVYASVCKTI